MMLVPAVRRLPVTMLKPAKNSYTADNQRSVVRQRGSTSAALFWLLLLVALLPLLWYLVPAVFATYYAQQAGILRERAIAWPQPRRSDSLPELRDQAAATAALDQLRAAILWQPDKADLYRRTAEIHAANSHWNAAADALGDAQRLEPNDPLAAWELALVTERLLEQVRRAPREKIVADLLSATVEAPSTFADTTYCEAGRPASCYVAFERYSQPFVAEPDGEPVQLDSLVMFPPSAVALEREIYASQPVLTFAMGLDPNLWGGSSDGATFEVWISAAGTPRQRVYQYDFPAADSVSGWIPGQVDLSAWAGQSVTLELRTTGGAAGNTTQDWLAWGDVSLTTAEAATINRVLVERRLRELWKAGRLDAGSFVARGDELLHSGAVLAADAWYQRALLVGNDLSQAVQFRARVAAAAAAGSLAGAAETVVEAPLAGAGLTIPATELRWLAGGTQAAEVDGTRLGELATPQPHVGALWWGGAAVMLLNSPVEGRYRVSARVQNTAPAPVELAIEHNLQPVREVSLDRGDWSWEVISAEVTLREGINVIGIRILNDTRDGVDHNALLEWLQIDTISGGSG